MTRRPIRSALVATLAATAALSLGSAALAQPAQRFTFMAEAQSGVGFIDPTTVRKQGPFKTAEMLMVLRPDGDGRVAYAVVTIELDCAGKRSHTTRGTLYDSSNALLGSADTPDRPFTADNMSAPDTIAVYSVVCDGKAPVGPFSGTAVEAYRWASARF